MSERIETKPEQPEPAKLDTPTQREPGDDILQVDVADGSSIPETPTQVTEPLTTSPETEYYRQQEQLAEIEPGVGPKPSSNAAPTDSSTDPSKPAEQNIPDQDKQADAQILRDEQFETMRKQGEIERERKLEEVRNQLQQFQDKEH
ncbi:MAG: hypothetical protein SH847_25535 [Roseiflexaceae bacterium]|nr:hypothetical protein [Roseiflexaceae bacterium]